MPRRKRKEPKPQPAPTGPVPETLVDYIEAPMMERGTWAVDGEVQDAELTEATLQAALESKPDGAPVVVAVARPLHLALARIIGRQPRPVPAASERQ